MPPIVLTVLQGLFLLLLYVFLARAVRAVIRDVRASSAPGMAARRPPGRAARRAAKPERSRSRRPPTELVVHGSGGRPEVVPLDDAEVVLGRADSATVTVSDPYASDHHARVYRDGDEWMVADLGSTNGTFVNQVKVSAPTRIAAGDQLGIGRTVVEVRR